MAFGNFAKWECPKTKQIRYHRRVIKSGRNMVIDFNTVPLSALTNESRSLLCSRLNTKKVLPIVGPDNLSRHRYIYFSTITFYSFKFLLLCCWYECKKMLSHSSSNYVCLNLKTIVNTLHYILSKLALWY